MATAIRLTITEAAASIKRRFGPTIPVWKLRRVIDSMEASGTLDVQRIANYRTISGDDVGTIASELQRRGWLAQQRDKLLPSLSEATDAEGEVASCK